MKQFLIGMGLALLGSAALAADAPAPAIAAPGQASAPASASQTKIALLVDLGSGQTLFAHNPTTPFLPASITKSMTLLVAFDLIAAGKLREDQLITVRPETAQTWSGKGTSFYLKPGMQVSLRDLLLGISTASANDAAVVVAESSAGSVPAWLDLMNARAKSLGMTSSRFATPNGWPDGGKTQVSARDLILLGQALVQEHPQLYQRYIGKPAVLWNGATFANHDPFAGVVPGADGIKTGHTREAGFNFLGSVERAGRRLMIVIGGAPSETARAAAARDLVEWGFAAWQSRPVAAAGTIVGAAKVQDGDSSSVPLALVAPLQVALQGAPASAARLKTRIVYRGPLQAPIQRGKIVAELELAVDGGTPARFPLRAARDIDRAGPMRRIINAIMGIVE